jgi:predicted ATPase
VVEHIVARTDGVPLFVEELVKMILESGLVREEGDHYVLTGPLPPLAIPSTLHDSLMARLDRLATVKEVAQLGATLGRTFAYELLQAVSPLDEATLQQGLRQLVEAELVYQRGTPPQATYMFKHALIQETAYQSLLRSTRQQFHQRIAQVLEARFPATVETQPELLAHHYTEAGLAAQAVVNWQRAGERAVERSANVEAISHLTTALTLLPALPDTPERTQHELTLLTVLGIPLVLTKGHAAPEVEATYARARTLCQQLGDTPQLFSVLLGLRRMYFMRAEYQTAHAVGEQLLRLAERLDDAGLCVRAHMMLAEGLLYLGEFAPARAHAEQGIALYDPQRHRVQVVHYGNDPGVCCRLFAALALWVLGYPDQAQQRSEEALAWAQELAHPFSLAFALIHAARLHQDRREGALTYTRAEAGIALATAQGFVLFLAHGPILRGWALAEQGQAAEGLAQIRQGIAAKQAIGVESGRSYNLALLADVYGKVGQLDEGLRVLTEAQTVAQATGERFYEAELSRLTGELLRAQSSENHAAAEACFQQALDVAHRQQAKSWELRAAMSLSRLWQRQGKRGAAYQLLAEVYGWFTEGFDTADLQEAKALLAQLA